MTTATDIKEFMNLSKPEMVDRLLRSNKKRDRCVNQQEANLLERMTGDMADIMKGPDAESKLPGFTAKMNATFDSRNMSHLHDDAKWDAMKKKGVKGGFFPTKSEKDQLIDAMLKAQGEPKNKREGMVMRKVMGQMCESMVGPAEGFYDRYIMCQAKRGMPLPMGYKKGRKNSPPAEGQDQAFDALNKIREAGLNPQQNGMDGALARAAGVPEWATNPMVIWGIRGGFALIVILILAKIFGFI